MKAKISSFFLDLRVDDVGFADVSDFMTRNGCLQHRIIGVTHTLHSRKYSSASVGTNWVRFLQSFHTSVFLYGQAHRG